MARAHLQEWRDPEEFLRTIDDGHRWRTRRGGEEEEDGKEGMMTMMMAKTMKKMMTRTIVIR